MPTAGSLQEIAREHTKIHAKGKGGNTKFTCNHCNKEFTGSQTRQLAHLTGTSGSGVAACQEIDDDLRNAINIEVDRLGRVKSGSKASSNHIDIPGQVPCNVTASLTDPMISIMLSAQMLSSVLPKDLDSQQLQSHLQTKGPLIQLLQSSSMPMGYLCTLSGNCDSLHCHCTLKITNNISAFDAGLLYSRRCVRLSARAMWLTGALLTTPCVQICWMLSNVV